MLIGELLVYQMPWCTASVYSSFVNIFEHL